MGDRQFHIFSSIKHLVCPQNFAHALFSVSPGKAVIPRRDKKNRCYAIFLFGGWGGGRMEANKVYYGRCANGEFFSSQHRNLKSKLSTGWRISDQEYCLRIQNEVKIPQSHIYPKASFVLGSFRAILSSHSSYFCALSRRCRISCFPVFKLVRFYVNSNKKPNTSMSFIVAFSSIFHDNFNLLFLFSVWKAVDILFRTV